MSGFWSLFIMLFIMFYLSDLRKNLIAPTYQPEINTDEDVLTYDVEVIYTDAPQEMLSDYYNEMAERTPELFHKAILS